ncbi:sensor histidine kinase [Agathobacter sp.]
MEDEENKGYLKNYIRRNLMWILLIIVMSVIHLLYMCLINAKMTDVLYAGILDLILLIIVGGIGFIRYISKVKRLKGALKRPVGEQLSIPEPRDNVEQLYGQLLENQDIARREAVSGALSRQTLMKDYYSMWVHQIKIPISAMNLLLAAQKDAVGELMPDDDVDYGTDDQTDMCVELADNISSLEDELFRIEEYVNMALQYQRISNTENDLVLGKISLDRVIRDTIRKYAKTMIRRRIKINYTGTDQDVFTDEKWLAFILEQILSNAIKYTSKGAITIEIVNETNWCFITVKDTGIGIRSEDLPRIFEKGYTGYNGHADKKATGIGLYLCKQMLDKLGHTIRVESEVGKGTTVWIGFNLKYVDTRD